MNYQHLLEYAQDYVLTYYKTHDTTSLLYHNQQHTEEVVEAAIKIANHYQLNDHDFFIVMASAWFHDLGYMEDINNHEEHSVKIALAFFEQHKLHKDDEDLIKGCIMATKMPQAPNTLLEEILCDADLFHLGLNDFFKKDKLLFKEINILHHADMSKLEWREKSVKFLEAHTYHTDYCRLLLNGDKQKNIEELKNKVEKEEKEEEKENDKAARKEEKKHAEMVAISEGIPLEVTAEPEQKKKKKKDKEEKPEKGIETMFRISSSNHQRLSDMADKKAHIMITVNSIIMSAIISLVLRRLNEYGYLIIPSFILLTVSLLAMTFSILSTRPSIPNGTFTPEDLEDKKVNLLFFGNFYKMKLEEFNNGMQMMMEDKDFLYGSLIKDLYAQGVVLGKKYHLLRIAYNIFMFGLIVAVIAFIIASAFFSHNPSV
ncbi:Pycsar system effector family protein [Mucilaginibacter sp.]|uniref:Pycsar system effector family protein n=1 Tax=Mucilaginibacter sp. TaxID=1882438 RepID=UPI003D0E68B2